MATPEAPALSPPSALDPVPDAATFQAGQRGAQDANRYAHAIGRGIGLAIGVVVGLSVVALAVVLCAVAVRNLVRWAL